MSAAAASADPTEAQAQQQEWPSTPHADAERMVEKAQIRNMTVRFMLDKLNEAGCGVGPDFFRVEHCDALVGGGFRPPDGVVICHNHVGSQQEIDVALVHELIHAYDHCRGANLDWSNCQHHACSEIRAASLSGDCTFRREVLRGNYGIRRQHQVQMCGSAGSDLHMVTCECQQGKAPHLSIRHFEICVRRRAELSVAMNPHCGPKKAKAAVDKVFDQCFADTAPFDRIP